MSSSQSTPSSVNSKEDFPLPPFSPLVEQSLAEGKAAEVMDQVKHVCQSGTFVVGLVLNYMRFQFFIFCCIILDYRSTDELLCIEVLRFVEIVC